MKWLKPFPIFCTFEENVVLKNPTRVLSAVLFLFSISLSAPPQQKLLTIDDIFDPARKVNFNGTVPNIRWLKDGRHYLLANDATRKDLPGCKRTDAVREADSCFAAGEIFPSSRRWPAVVPVRL